MAKVDLVEQYTKAQMSQLVKLTQISKNSTSESSQSTSTTATTTCRTLAAVHNFVYLLNCCENIRCQLANKNVFISRRRLAVKVNPLPLGKLWLKVDGKMLT